MATWHEELAEAVKVRDKAIRGVLRWQEKKHEAEARIDALSAQRKTDDLPPAVEAPVTDYGVLIDADLNPAFGITADQSA